ncbi:MAG: hypothetical protein E6Q97_34750 [Desulfurellales bacterium]|nr:MAG: hypothetical protein E6Q97_34750 [Desulfurellales bacterium]
MDYEELTERLEAAFRTLPREPRALLYIVRSDIQTTPTHFAGVEIFEAEGLTADCPFVPLNVIAYSLEERAAFATAFSTCK